MRVTAGEIYDLIPLASACIAEWDAFLAQYALDPRTLSDEMGVYVVADSDRESASPHEAR